MPVLKPTSKAELAEVITALSPDLIAIVAYGMILPKIITDTFTCWNVHGSLLPKYRGPSPIQSAILNQDDHTGVTIMQINESMDCGDIIAQASVEISQTDTFGSLYQQLSESGAALFLDCLHRLIQAPDTLIKTAQDSTQATYCRKIEKADTELLPTDSIITRLVS